MIPWIQVYSNILTHDKTYKLAEALKIPNYSAVGLMVSLWCWVAVNAPDGDITSYPPRAITAATGWPKKPEAFYSALVDAELIEKKEDGRAVIRNWEQYAQLLMDLMDSQKRKTADRVKKHRARRKAREEAGEETPQTPEAESTPPNEALPVTSETDDVKRNCNVTETESNALHNITGHNITGHNPSSYEEDNNSFVVDVDGCAGAQRAVEDYFESNGLNLESYFGQTEQTMQTARDITSRIFHKCSTRKPTELDVARVFCTTMQQQQNSTGQWDICFDEGKIQLLMYAFEQAVSAGCPGNWNYIGGCLGKLRQRGIKTLDEADAYDVQRDFG